MLVSAPALAAGAVIVSALGHFGINEIWAFMIAMPLLLFAWYYFVGGLIDRKRKVIS